MRILVLSRKPEIASVRRLVEEIERAGHQPLVLDPESPDLKRARPDLVIPRFGTYRFEESLAALSTFERMQVPVLDRTEALREARNKWLSYLVLREAGLPVPATRLHTKADLPKSFPYVAKRLDGSKGENVHLVANAGDLMALEADGEWLAQDFIAEAQGRDHRLFVIEGRVVAAMERRAPPGDFRSNLALGGEAHPYRPTSLELTTALAATKLLGLRVAGVDLIPSRNGPLILEVNGCPGLEGIEKASGVNVAADVVAAGLRLAGDGGRP